MAADLPLAIVLALGAAAAGGPEAVALLLHVAGRSPAADVLLALFLISAHAALVLGTMLLALYVRVADAAPLRPATARFARVTLAVAVAVMLFVSACLLTLPFVPAGVGGAASTCTA
jgi:hypothetical protein